MTRDVFEWLVIAVPLMPGLVALWLALALAVGLRPREATISKATLGATLGGAAAAVIVLGAVVQDPTPTRVMVTHWLFVPGHEIDVAFWIDPLSAIMMAMTTVLAFAVSYFSVTYLHREPGFCRFFMLINLFVAGMLLLVMGDGFTLVFLGWEWVGICSALLIGFFHERAAPVAAGARAFYTNRLGDFGLLTAGLFASHYLGGDGWQAMIDGAPSLSPALVTIMGLALWLAAMSKSAQFPFSSWMAHAVEGPTASTGLFYGAVMAHAGVYLMLRAGPLVVQSDVTMLAMIVIGGITLVYATAVGAAQADAKSAIIYATIAQLGGMFAALGAGAWQLVVVLMVLHAGLRAMQFLFAPSIIVRTRAARHQAAANTPAARAGVVHTGLLGTALLVAAWSIFGLSDATWCYGPSPGSGPLGGARDAVLASIAIGSALAIAYVGSRRRAGLDDREAAARLHHRALHRFDLDALQVRLVAHPLLVLSALLKRLDDRFRDATRAFVGASLVVALVVAIEGGISEVPMAQHFRVMDRHDASGVPWLSALWLLPLLGALVVHRVRDEAWARVFARTAGAATLAIAIAVIRRFQTNIDGMQFVERIGSDVFGIGYHLGVDGVSAPLAFVQTLVVALVLVAVGPRTRRDALVALLLFHGCGLLALASINLFVVAVAGLVAIAPAAALLRAAAPAGDPPPKVGAYVRPKLVSGVLLLGVVLMIGGSGDSLTFDLELIAEAGVPGVLEAVLIVPLLIAVAIQLPLVPFHGWMVRVIERSPAIASVPLTLIPFGQFVYLRIGAELLGSAVAPHASLLSTLAVGSMFYCVFVGFAQGGLRSSLAYFQLAIAGSMLVGATSNDPMALVAGLVNAGNLAIAGTGLLLIADMIHARVGSTDYAALGGIVRTAPVLSGLLLVVALAYAGFPGTLGFSAEHLASHGAFDAHPALAMAMLGAANLASALLFWSFTRSCLGPWRTRHLSGFPELLGRERLVLLTIAVIVSVAGWWLEPWIALIEPTVAFGHH